MKVIFLGTGEAFDENYLNNSCLVVSNKTNLLLDCGMTTPYQLWKYNNDQGLLDAVYISHSHADHYFGLPALLNRMREEKRKKDLVIIFSEEKVIKDLIDFGYKGLYPRLGFKVIFQKTKDIKINDLNLSFAKTNHVIDNLAVKIESRGRSVCYSGDGGFTPDAEKLYSSCDLLIHEAYLFNRKEEGHGCVTDLIKMAERNNIKCLALTHINRFLRKDLTKKKIYSKKVNIKVPNNFEQINI